MDFGQDKNIFLNHTQPRKSRKIAYRSVGQTIVFILQIILFSVGDERCLRTLKTFRSHHIISV